MSERNRILADFAAGRTPKEIYDAHRARRRHTVIANISGKVVARGKEFDVRAGDKIEWIGEKILLNGAEVP